MSIACSAMAVSAIVSCSPMARSMSISRAFGVSVSALALAMSSLVTPERADTTTTRPCPSSRDFLMRWATFLIRSISPTEVPPYFWTIKAMLETGLNGVPACRLARRDWPPCVISQVQNHLRASGLRSRFLGEAWFRAGQQAFDVRPVAYDHEKAEG